MIEDCVRFSPEYLASLLAHRRLAQAIIRAKGGISSTEYGILSLAQRTVEYTPTIKSVSTLLLLQPRTVQLATGKLATRGYISKGLSELDRREVVIERTLSGTTLLGEVQRHLSNIFEETLFAHIPIEEREAILPLIYEKVSLTSGSKESGEIVPPHQAIPPTFFAGIAKTLRVYEQVLAEQFDLTLNGYRLIDCLSEEESTTLSDVARFLRIQNSVVTAERYLLETRGLLALRPSSSGPSAAKLMITKQGKALAGEAFELLSRTTRKMNEGIDSSMARKINAWHMRMYCDLDIADGEVARLRREAAK